MARYDYILEDVRKLCDYVLKYCDVQAGCQDCDLQGINFGDQSQKCPIYLVSMLDEELYERGVEVRE